MKRPRKPIKIRIAEAFRGVGSWNYFRLMKTVFPPADYPRAYRYQANGGPPGCAMAFGKALRELGATWGRDRMVYKTRAITRMLEDLSR